MARGKSGDTGYEQLGAATRLGQLDRERAAILKAYPALRRAKESIGSVSVGQRPRRKISAAARKRMSAGMRRFWARRKGQTKPKAEKPKPES